MKNTAAAIILALALSMPTAARAGDGPEWQVVADHSRNTDRELPEQQEAVEVTVKDGAVYIAATGDVKVEVFTILGQLITTRKVTEGVVRLTLNQRGVYILKAGPITKRINL